MEGKKGRKKQVNRSKWKTEERKLKRQSGESYTTVRGKCCDAKHFREVQKCCINTCCLEFSKECQHCIFKRFWGLGDKLTQDQFLVGCMKKQDLQTVSVRASKKRENIWKYSLRNEGQCRDVCRSFLLSILQISEKRLRTVQSRLTSDLPLNDGRGRHNNRPRNVDNKVWHLAREHLETIPYSFSHYSHSKTQLKYFENPNLSVKLLYRMFKKYYHDNTGVSLALTYKRYHKFFRESCNFSFRQPQKDVCDFCCKCQVKLKTDENSSCKTEYILHKREVEAYNLLKKQKIDESKENLDVICIEFDYAQNLPLPKLNCTAQFYKRLIWFYVFNVHVHSSDSNSYMYTFLETEGKKNADSVISFVHTTLMQLLEIRPFKTIVLFSDGAGGQNKNFKFLTFISWFSKVHDVKMLHIFPVRGHSYSQCDRNFGLYSIKIRKIPTVETAKEYLEVISSCRKKPQPYSVLWDSSILKEWSGTLNPYFMKKPTSKQFPFQIQKYRQILCEPSGRVFASKSYGNAFNEFTFWKREYVASELKNVTPPKMKPVPLKQTKEKDIRDLFPFLNEDSRNWYEDLIDEAKQGSAAEETEDEVL